MKENCDKIIYENGEYFFEEMYNIKSDRIELVSIYYNRESCNRYRNEKGEEIAFFNLMYINHHRIDYTEKVKQAIISYNRGKKLEQLFKNENYEL